MKLYLSLAVLTAIYIIALTLGVTTAPSSLLWNGVIGFMLSISLVLSVIPLIGLLFYETALQILTSSLNPPVDISLLTWILKIASFIINILFTIALVLYVLQKKRAYARRVIKTLLF
ncbi:conserved hypothetical protein [Pyrobaculum islandicum DSM 4184]|uniref:Uncharacterized protein n=1 Tax=Pyrobaculum islandicum (strain DSM 4184 / JCM 9189 / GEO3) TaxID=384616 RepID=A1RT56_PYRIL|nr:hypothetical protein [Pyrobaculum islandicum]ABL88138.1 conserved hypothetical protein [Pyrobaculum islandicum DSM 4184]